MKGLAAALLLGFGMIISASGALIAYEPFNYGTPGAPSGRDGGMGWKAAWKGDLFAVGTGLHYPSLVTSGNRARLSGAGTRATRQIETNGFERLLTPSGKFGRPGTEIWISFCFSVERTSVNRLANMPSFQLMEGDFSWVYIQMDESVIDRNPGQGWPTLLVARIQFLTDGTSMHSIFYNPVPGVIPPSDPEVFFNMGTPFQFDRIAIAYRDPGATASYDDIRIGETYADVAPSNGRLEVLLQTPTAGKFSGTTERPNRLAVLVAGPDTDSAAVHMTLRSDSPAIAGPANLRWLPSTNRTEGKIEVEAIQSGTVDIFADVRKEPFAPGGTNFSLQISGGTPAGLIAYEGFDYPMSPSTLHGRNGGFGFKSTWSSSGRSQVVADSLFQPGLQNTGNHIENVWSPSGPVLSSRPLATTLGQSGTVRYISLLAQPKGQLHQGEYSGYFGVEIPGSAGGKLFIGKPGHLFIDNWVIESSEGAWQGSSHVTIATNKTALLVVKMEFFDGPDRFSLYVNPTPGEDEPSSPSAVIYRFDLGKASSLTLSSTGAWALDELRIGSTWASVTPNPSAPMPLKLNAPAAVYAPERAETRYRATLAESIAPLQPDFVLLSGPPGMTIDPQTGLINYSPSEMEEAASFPVRIQVTDNSVPARSDEVAFDLHVFKVNQEARLENVPQPLVVQPGMQFVQQLAAVDTDIPASEITFTLTSGPEGFTISPSGKVEWTVPEDYPVGITNVTFVLEDRNSSDLIHPVLQLPQTLEFLVEPAKVDPVPFGILESRMVGGSFVITVASQKKIKMTLERASSLSGPWVAVTEAGSPDANERVQLADPNPGQDMTFYRVRAE